MVSLESPSNVELWEIKKVFLSFVFLYGVIEVQSFVNIWAFLFTFSVIFSRPFLRLTFFE